MNFVYDPVNAAKITAYVQFVSPVARRAGGARSKLGGDAAALAESPLLFPDDERRPACTSSPTCPRTSTQRITDRFVTITGG